MSCLASPVRASRCGVIDARYYLNNAPRFHESNEYQTMFIPYFLTTHYLRDVITVIDSFLVENCSSKKYENIRDSIKIQQVFARKRTDAITTWNLFCDNLRLKSLNKIIGTYVRVKKYYSLHSALKHHSSPHCPYLSHLKTNTQFKIPK